MVVVKEGLATQASLDAEIREIRHLLDSPQGRFLFRFPEVLEGEFFLHLKQRALDSLRREWLVVLVFYLAIGISTFLQVRQLSHPLYEKENVIVWWAIYLAEGIPILGLMALPHFATLQKSFHLVTGALGMIALSAIIIGTSAFPDPYFNQHSSYVIIFIMSIIYGLGGLRLQTAMIACWSAVVVSWLVIQEFELWFNWGFYMQYAVLANLVGMLLCYLLELRDRQNFLQSRLLVLEKSKLDLLTQQLAKLSREDVLTGLANRRHFNETFQSEWDRARRHQQSLALIFVDIDHFKSFNDTHGHLEGDRVLSEVGRTLRNSLRRSGDMAARYGGEEFVILLPGATEKGAQEVAATALAAIRNLSIPHRASSVGGRVTASAGVAAVTPELGMRSTRLIAMADDAVYAAKAAGRDRVQMASQMPVAKT